MRVQELESRQIWSVGMIMNELDAISEIKSLAITPFMIQIVIQILPILKESRTTVSSVKHEIILRKGEEIAERAWAGLRRFELVSSDQDLERTQVSLCRTRICVLLFSRLWLSCSSAGAGNS